MWYHRLIDAMKNIGLETRIVPRTDRKAFPYIRIPVNKTWDIVVKGDVWKKRDGSDWMTYDITWPEHRNFGRITVTAGGTTTVHDMQDVIKTIVRKRNKYLRK